MNKKIPLFLIGCVLISSFGISARTVTASIGDESTVNETSYDFGFVIIETFSTSGSISGIPDYEHVGGLHDVDITTQGGSISLFFTIPVWGSAINYQFDDVHVHMDHFLGVTTSYANSGGCLVGIGKNITWEIQ
jgi:hypothetical protein